MFELLLSHGISLSKLEDAAAPSFLIGAVLWDSPSSGLYVRKIDDDFVFTVIEPAR